ncbi:MAG: hypothetical protein ACRD9R_08775 [Pyrinomonadaceae bacterium]
MLAFLLALATATSGALMTYCYDDDAPLYARLCAGVCIGLTALGLVGYVSSSFLGLTTLSLALSAVIITLPLALLARADWRARVSYDLARARRFASEAVSRPHGRAGVSLLLFLFGAVVLWLVFGRAMFVRGGEIYTGVDNNLGDLPFHLAIITSFTDGQNFPPQHPEYGGARLTYPFIVDFIAAMFARSGAALEGALFLENFLLGLALLGLLYRFAHVLTRSRSAALVAPALALLSGGFGWTRLWKEWTDGQQGLAELLWQLPHDYTISFDGVYRWGNALTTLFVPQRGLLLGLPLALVVITQWWRMTEGEERKAKGESQSGGEEETISHQQGAARKGKRKGRQTMPAYDPSSFSPFAFRLSPFASRVLGAGLVAGLLPLVHAHSFITLMLLGGCLALLFPRWRAWPLFFAAALVVSAPQMFWATRETAARPESFFAWQFGWDRGEQNPLWFWLNNTGLFIPLLVAAVAWRGRDPVVPKRLLLFYAPFTLLFVISNVGKISPWIWDNIKVLYYWYVASVPLVALLLARLWGRRGAWRAASVVLFGLLVLAGALDVWRVASGASEQREFDRAGVEFAELLKRETAPDSLILQAPTYNHPSYLAGRRALMGYGGHLWSQGISYAEREAHVRQMYAGGPNAEQLMHQYGVNYVVVGPLEQSALTVNEGFIQKLQKVGETGGYRLYQVARP